MADSNPKCFLRWQTAMVDISGLERKCPALFEQMLSTDGNVARLGLHYTERSEVGKLAAVGNGDANRVAGAIKVIKL